MYLTDGTLLNAEIIKQGYGFAYTRSRLSTLRISGDMKGRRRRIIGGCGRGMISKRPQGIEVVLILIVLLPIPASETNPVVNVFKDPK